MKEKNSFILYHAHGKLFAALTDQEAGQLIKAIFCYVTTGKCADITGAAKIAYISIVDDLDRNQKKYEQKCEKNRANASKRWGEGKSIGKNEDAIACDRIKRNANACERMPSDANRCLYDNDNDNDNDNDLKVVVVDTRARETDVFQCYEENIGMLTPTVRDCLISWQDTFCDDVLCLAIAESAKSGARSVRYVEKILINWESGGVKTADQARALVRDYQEKKAGGQKRPGVQQKNKFQNYNENAQMSDFEISALKKRMKGETP